jgi:hypothetical protein
MIGELASLKWEQPNFGVATMRIYRAAWSVTLSGEAATGA